MRFLFPTVIRKSILLSISLTLLSAEEIAKDSSSCDVEVPSPNTNYQEPCYTTPTSFCTQGSTLFLRHTAGEGLGYKKGYTTLDLFVAPSVGCAEWSPFVDLRGHVFNNGKWAANAGIGVRYLDSVAWGANVYYDFRDTDHSHYNQLGAGLEAIGSFWSVHVNGYWPFGRRKSSFFSVPSSPAGVPQFAGFQGNELLLQIQGSLLKKEFTFAGVNALADFRVFETPYFAIFAQQSPFKPKFLTNSIKPSNSFLEKDAPRGMGSPFTIPP